MGFLSKAFKNQIMSPIGRPIPAMGVRPMLREPGIDIAGERSIFGQQSPFGPPLTPPVNISGPVLPRRDPRIIPPRPRSIGGIGGINQPQPIMPINVPGGGGIDYGGGEGPPLLPLQPPSIGGPINIGTPITGQPLVPGSGNVPPIQDDGLVTDPYGNRIDPNNLPDNMVLEDGGLKGGMRAVFAPDYALQPNDPGYMSNDQGFNRGIEQIIRPPSIGGPGGGITSIGQIGQDPRIPRMINENPIPFDPNTPVDISNIGSGVLDPGKPIPSMGPPIQPKPIELNDFGFGPGIRPSEIITPDGQFIGSGGVTPPTTTPGSGIKQPMPVNDGPGSMGRPVAPILGGSDFLPKPPGDLTGIGQPLRNEIGPIGGSNADLFDPNVSAGSGFFDDPLVPKMINENPVSFDPMGPPKQPKPVELPDYGFGPGIRPTEIRGPDGRIIGPAGVTPPPPISDPVVDPVTPTVDPVVTPTAQTDPTQTQMAMGAMDPVLLQQSASEVQTDPLLRSLYFGTADQPGFYNQLQQAGANLIGSDVPLQQTAGLSPLELLARQQAISGIGGFEPFLQQNQNLVNQAIDQSRRAETLRDPYYGRAERQMQIGAGEELQGIGQARGITTGATDRFGGSLGRLGRQAIGSTQNYGGSLGESEDLLRGTLGAYDPGMTQQFYNPYEDRVVQQTIDDVLKAGDKQDIASRAREISSGAFGGSRARLGAEERRESLGKGLAQALGNIRSQGFQSAQATGLGEFARQRAAERAASSGLAGLSGSRLGAQQQLGSTLRGLTGDQFGAQQQLASSLMGYGAAGSGARQNLATGLLGIGQQRGAGASALGSQLAGYGSQIGGIGQTQEQMRAGQRGELSRYGTTGRGIAETGLGRIYEQQMGQQLRPLGVLGQIGSMLPGYQGSRTQIDSQYGMPTDPTAAGLGAAFSAYGAMAPKQGSI